MSDAEGHRLVEHTADVIVEAWAPSWKACFEQAILGFTSVFARDDGARIAQWADVLADTGPLTERLLAVLDELLFLLDARGLVAVVPAVAAGIDPATPFVVEIGLADATSMEIVGAIPKAVSRSDLSFGPVDAAGAAEGWRCRFTVDV